jgi:taurine-pyruvate aminotransferase
MNNQINPNDLGAVIEADRAHVWHHLIQHKPFEGTDPRIIVEGKGMRVWDATGKEYLDAVSGGVWTVNVGYGRERIADAMRDQLVRLPYFANSAGSIPGALFAERLIEKMPGMSRVYYTNSGSEANEKAFKMVRQIAHKRYGGKKHKILYRERDYHGSTIAAMSAGGQEERNAQYGPFAPGFVRVPHCLEYRAQWETGEYGVRAADAIEEVILREGPDTVGALCLEPVTAGGGVITPPEGYWDRVQEICRKYDILLHIDEVVCGVGRTGKWFGYQHYGIQPDFVTMAKGVASGYAAIACMVPRSRSERRRSSSSTVSSTMEIATRIVATARIVGEICSRRPVNICHGSVFCAGRAQEQHHHHLVEGGDEGETARPRSRPGRISGIWTLKKVVTGIGAQRGRGPRQRAVEADQRRRHGDDDEGRAQRGMGQHDAPV